MASAVRAQVDTGVPEVSLREVLQRARIDAPAVAAAAAAYGLREAERDAALGAYYPVLTMQGTSGYAHDNRLVLPGAPRIDSKSLTAEASVSLEWAAIDPARGDRADSSAALARAQHLATEAVRRNAVLLAAELYVQATAAALLTVDAQLSLERRTSQALAIADLVQAGTRSPVDMERAKIEALSARYALEGRRNDELAAYAALAAALGRPATHPVRPRADGLQALEVDAATARALALPGAGRPELRSQQQLIAARREEYSAALGARLPTLGVSASASISYLDVLGGEGIDGHQYGGAALLYLRWSGLDPAVWTRANVAGAAVARAESDLAATQHAIASEAVAATHAVLRAKTERERANAVLQAAELAREAQNGRYRAGVASMLELLDAENLEQDARRQRIEAERDYHVATARLLFASGRLDALAR